MGLMEKIKEIEAEMARTQKNKATNYHLGTLKAKLARLRNELFVEQSGGGGGGGGEGFDVARNGDARVALIGFPSVGKSSLLSAMTSTESLAANYEFTTLTCVPGRCEYKGSKLQILDLPGIIEVRKSKSLSARCIFEDRYLGLDDDRKENMANNYLFYFVFLFLNIPLL